MNYLMHAYFSKCPFRIIAPRRGVILIVEVNLHNSRFGDRGAASLAVALKSQERLGTLALRLGGTQLTPDGNATVLRSFAGSSLRRLELSLHGVDGGAIAAVLQTLEALSACDLTLREVTGIES